MSEKALQPIEQKTIMGMDKNRSAQPTEQKQVDFYGDELTAVRMDDGNVYVSIRHMCDALGIDTQGQTRRIKRSDVLEGGYGWVDILSTQPNPQRRKTQVLRVDLVPLFLTGVSTKSVNEDVRPKLKRFQQEAAKVLWQAFQEGRLTADPIFDDLMAQDTPEASAVRMAEAVLRLARNQLMMRAQIDDHTLRLEAIEAQLGDPGRMITPAQATNISQAVKAVAMTLSKASGRNEYGGVYGELYRRFEVPSYKEVPASKYDDVMAWLNEWLQSVTSDQPF